MATQNHFPRTLNGRATVLYEAWNSMRQRINAKDPYKKGSYAARGITICQEWLESFDQFCEDMGPRPAGHSLEREDNDKGYSPDNCVWGTRSQQSKNRRPQANQRTGNRDITFEGKTLHLSAWAKELGIKRSTLHMRLFIYQWPVEKAFTTPAVAWNHRREEVVEQLQEAA